MKKIKVEDSVGMVLAHDITEIIPGKVKGPAFKKGHIVQSEDIPKLLNLGKEHLFVWEAKEGWFHEDEAARAIMEATAGVGLSFSEPKEGKINYMASYDGVLKVDVSRLLEINSVDQIVLSTLHNNRPVKAGQIVAATRVIPLVIEEEKINRMQEAAKGASVVYINAMYPMRVGIVTTGSEVYKGRIKDGFGPALRKKMEQYNCEIINQAIVPDDKEEIKEAIRQVREKGAQIILVTGGMSVDPDDVTPLSIREIGADIVSYGAPVHPGAMFLLAYWDGIPLMGLPGCVMYSKQTVFDLVFPRILTNETLGKRDLVELGHGGLCQNCTECNYPACSFGKA